MAQRRQEAFRHQRFWGDAFPPAPARPVSRCLKCLRIHVARRVWFRAFSLQPTLGLLQFSEPICLQSLVQRFVLQATLELFHILFLLWYILYNVLMLIQISSLGSFSSFFDFRGFLLCFSECKAFPGTNEDACLASTWQQFLQQTNLLEDLLLVASSY